jgi:hypothetical protein
MTDDPTKRNSPDSKLISLTEPHEVRYWTHKLGVSLATLTKVVDDVGPSAAAVRAYLTGGDEIEDDGGQDQGEGA